MPTVPAPDALLDLAPPGPVAAARVFSAEVVTQAVLDDERLAALRADGPTPWAFSFRHSFAAGAAAGAIVDPRELCPAG